ncbi:flagellar assembly protein A [Sulfuricurvum sp.]|uniref:flagellar assembly protein A n=1 Tax=Sulfuricurvum sp. TaxID=2025608 RepID=UPI002E377004|nr:flagellar assembly protein A [Sulfuricurvum sp.]HEX5328765.1 flagellar assembly protein A [Sulfuricurvum sp.]
MSTFIPTTILSTNVMQDLKNASLAQRVPIDSLDFDLLSYETSFKGSVDEEWEILQGDDLLTQTTENEIRSPHFLLQQEYQIHIRLAKPHPYLDLQFTIATDKTKSKVIAVIEPTSTIPLKKGVQEWIKEAIIRKQLRHGLMIGLYDQGVDREINRLIGRIQKEGPLSAPYRLSIGEFFLPTMPINDKIILHYKEANDSKSLIEGVNPGDLILEYILPKPGRDGRACTGAHIAVPEPIIKFAPYATVDPETVSTEEDEESVRYYASVSGYVERKNGIFYISQELQIESASFKKTGSIETGIDKDVSLKIKKKVSSEDAVGMGVNIDVQKLDVSGTVGGNAKIQACEVNIGAQTHKKSQINVSETANVHLHRGDLKAKEANINILEVGKVEADVIRIKKMVGGEIIGREIYIDTLYSNARITALESITIENIEGDGNNLIIDPHAIERYHQKIVDLEAQIKEKNTQLQTETKNLSMRQSLFNDKNSRIKDIQARVLIRQKNGETPMKADLVRLQQYKLEREALQEATETINTTELALQAMQETLDKLYEADLHAVITHHGIYNGHTRILFIDPKTRREYSISPEGHVTHVRLQKVEDDKKFRFESK